MGVFDFLKKTKPEPDYELLDLAFCGADGASAKKQYGDYVAYGSCYVFTRLRVKVNRAVSFHWYIKILQPSGKWLPGPGRNDEYYSELQWTFPSTGASSTLECPGLGNTEDSPFTIPGAWHWFICDDNDNILIHKSFYILSLEEVARQYAYMDIQRVEFTESRNAKLWREAEDTDFTSELCYLYGRITYAGRGGWTGERPVKLDIEIEKPDGKVDRFSSEVTVRSGGGTVVLSGWGNDKATYYFPGEYIYRIRFEGRLLYRTRIRIGKSPKDSACLSKLAFMAAASDSAFPDFFADSPEPVLSASQLSGGFIWFRFCYVNASKTPVKLYVKVTAPDGNLVRGGDPSLVGYTFEKLLEAGSDIGRNNATMASFGYGFSYGNHGVPMKGDYNVSLWAEIKYTGKTACLYSTRISVR